MIIYGIYGMIWGEWKGYGSVLLVLFADDFDGLFACFELVDPILAYSLHLAAKLVFLKPDDELGDPFAVYFLYHVYEDQLDDSALVFNRFEDPIELLGESLEDCGFFREAILEFGD